MGEGWDQISTSLDQLWLDVARRAGIEFTAAGVVKPRSKRRRVSISEWMAMEYRFASIALETLLGHVTEDDFLPTLSLLALPQYTRGFGRRQRRQLVERALVERDAWWQRWDDGGGARSTGARGAARDLVWRHDPIPWSAVCAGASVPMPIRLGPFVQPPACYDLTIEVSVALASPEQTPIRVPGVAWPASIEASIYHHDKCLQAFVALDVPSLRWSLTPPLPSSVTVESNAVRTDQVVAGMSTESMAILIAACLKKAGMLSGPDEKRAVLEVEVLLGRVRRALDRDQDAGRNSAAVARAVWTNICAWKVSPTRPQALDKYLRLASRRLGRRTENIAGADLDSLAAPVGASDPARMAAATQLLGRLDRVVKGLLPDKQDLFYAVKPHLLAGLRPREAAVKCGRNPEAVEALLNDLRVAADQR